MRWPLLCLQLMFGIVLDRGGVPEPQLRYQGRCRLRDGRVQDPRGDQEPRLPRLSVGLRRLLREGGDGEAQGQLPEHLMARAGQGGLRRFLRRLHGRHPSDRGHLHRGGATVQLGFIFFTNIFSVHRKRRRGCVVFCVFCRKMCHVPIHE